MSDKTKNSNKTDFLFIFIPMLVASLLPEIISYLIFNQVPTAIVFVKIGLIGYFMSTSFAMKVKNSTRFYLILIFINVAQLINATVGTSEFFLSLLDASTFSGVFGGAILLKMLGALLVFFILIFSFNSPSKAFIGRGDDKKTVGDRESDKSLTWKMISIPAGMVMGLVISVLIFAINNASPDFTNLGFIISSLPIIIVLAMLNSLSEGLMYRSAIIASLHNSLTKKQVIIVATTIFALAQFFEPFGGLLGVLVNIVIGYVLSLSVYETGGFKNAWMMHFIKDFIIFSSLLMVTFM
jgi:membrane protease YdiL (CAAX protease family)